MLVVGPNKEKIQELMKKASKKTKLKLKNLRTPTSFLGLDITIKEGKSISLNLTRYTKKYLEQWDPNNSIPYYNTLVELGIKLEKSSYIATIEEVKDYQ